MSANENSQQIFPGNLLWAAASSAAVLVTSLVVCNAFRPTADIELRKADSRTEVRKKIAAEESAKLGSIAWVKKDAGVVRAPVEVVKDVLLKELAQKKAGPSVVKVDPLPPAASGGAPSLPSAPGGASNVMFPRVGPAPAAPAPAAPAPAAPAPAAPAPAAPAPAAPAPAAPAPAAPAPGN
jgi:hypothetical protein